MSDLSSYPLYDFRSEDVFFVLEEYLNVRALSEKYEYGSDYDRDLIEGVADFAKNEIFPFNKTGDEQGCKLEGTEVTTPDGTKELYEACLGIELTQLVCKVEHGGMDVPTPSAIAIKEILCATNMAFGMYLGLSEGNYKALDEFAPDEIKEKYLPKLASGQWTGTMCLTEGGAGTDLGLMETKAAENEDGSFNIKGKKIFISAGEHDLAENILHLVLAKIDAEDTPDGIGGVSLFLVPKFLPDESGNVGERNGVECVGLEEKMGIHANSTCQMEFGQEVPAKGFLIGERHKGMKAMFVMMNEARLGVGMQGLGLSETDFQNMYTYAHERKQGTRLRDTGKKDAETVSIIEHPAVWSRVNTVRAQVEGGRALAYWVAKQIDISHRDPDEKVRKKAKGFVDLLTPIVKAHLTDNAEENAKAARRVFGGVGFTKDFGVEQRGRDAAITPIYEGTNDVQALDLVLRKALAKGLLKPYLAHVHADLKKARRNGVPFKYTLPVYKAAGLLLAKTTYSQGKYKVAEKLGKDTGLVIEEAGSLANEFLDLASMVAMGHQWVNMIDISREKLKADAKDPKLDEKKKGQYLTKIQTGDFYFAKVMKPQMAKTLAAMKVPTSKLMKISKEAFMPQSGDNKIQNIKKSVLGALKPKP